MDKFHLHSGLALQCRLGPVGKKTTCLRRVTKLLVNDLADIIAAQNSINLGSDTHRKERWWKAEGAGGKKMPQRYRPTLTFGVGLTQKI